MPISIGNSGVKEIYVGGAPVSAVYAGTSLVWQRRKKTDVLKAYFDYKGFTTWEGASNVTVPELGVSWTVVAPVPAGEEVAIGGVTISNTGSLVQAVIRSNSSSMALVHNGSYSGSPVVMVCASKDWYGYRARMWVDGVDVATNTNGGAFSSAESAQGGTGGRAPEWAAFKVGEEVGDVHKGGDVKQFKQAIGKGAVDAGYEQEPYRSRSFSLPAMKGFRWVTAHRAQGGKADQYKKLGGSAGQTGLVVHDYDKAVTVEFRDGDVGTGGRWFRKGADSAMPTWRGEDSPRIGFPWGSGWAKQEAAGKTISGYASHRRPGSGGSYIEGSDGKADSSAEKGGDAATWYWLSV